MFFNRCSRPEVFCKKGVLRGFGKLSGKFLGKILLFNKVADLRTTALLKNRLRCLPVNFVKLVRTRFFYRTPLVAASIDERVREKINRSRFCIEADGFVA